MESIALTGLPRLVSEATIISNIKEGPWVSNVEDDKTTSQIDYILYLEKIGESRRPGGWMWTGLILLFRVHWTATHRPRPLPHLRHRLCSLLDRAHLDLGGTEISIELSRYPDI